MPLPTLFAALTNATGAELDADFAALGALTTITCTIAGSNTLTLVPGTLTPTVAAYSQGQAYSGIVAATNTGAATAQIGTLPALAIYKDTQSGPVALTGNEMVAGNFVALA